MTRIPHGIPEDVLITFVTVVVLSTAVVAFIAYVGTWVSARRHRRRTRADAKPARLDGGHELAAGRPEGNARAPRVDACECATATRHPVAVAVPADDGGGGATPATL